jgi:queuosine biosynthesis protein QueD
MSSAGKKIEQALLNTDGGSRGNPGESGIGFTLNVDDGRELVTLCHGGAYIGVATNNVAEYRALIWGLRNARALKVRKIDVRADSELLVRQLLGKYRVKNVGIKPLFTEARQLLESFESYRIEHVPREDNSDADRLANEAMDTRGMVGNYAVGYESGDLFSLALAPPPVDGAPAAPTAGVSDGASEPPSGPPSEPPSATASDGASEPAPSTAGDASLSASPATDASSPVAGSSSKPSKRNRKGTLMTNMPAIGIYTLTVKEHFDAAHALVGYPGECKNLHGHTWDVEVSVRGTELDEVGIVYDFKKLKGSLAEILEHYDHHYLNEVPPFDTINATAENLARVIYEQLGETLPEGVELVEVVVWESPIAKLTYSR